MITRTEDGGAIEMIRAHSHRYTGKLNDEGVMELKQLDDNDGTHYVNSSEEADLTTLGTDVWMKLPQFYYKAVESSTNVWDITFAFGTTPDGDDWKEWTGNDLIGVYEAYSSNSNLYSVSGVTSSGSITQANFKTYARNRGDGFTIVKWKHHCIMAFLFYAYYGNTNCQALIGSGTNSYTKVTGATNSLGMEDTDASTNGNSQSINFWGLENWWGNKYEWVDNVVVNARVWNVTEDDGTVRIAGTGGSSNGYVSKLLIGENLDMIPTAASASSTTGYCDYYYQSSSHSRVVSRSRSRSFDYGGVAFANADYDASDYSSSSGSRLAYVGNFTTL